MNDLTRLEQTVDRFCEYINSLPASALAEQVWGPKEVLAHLVYHHELYAQLVAAFLEGRPAAPPRGRFRDLNARAVAASRGLPVEELVDRFQKANRRLVRLYRRQDPMAIPVEIKVGAKIRTLATLVPEVEAHIRNHLKKLRKAGLPAP